MINLNQNISLINLQPEGLKSYEDLRDIIIGFC